MHKTFVISDTWFNRNLIDTDVSVSDINNAIISAWNCVVDDSDDVYVLGGFGISDLYNIVVRLKGRIHFLDNYFNVDEHKSIEDLNENVQKSGDINIINRIVFEHKQIMILNEFDIILSYFPLNNWSGKETGTICFHGLDNSIDIQNHIVSAMSSYWSYSPVCIDDLKESFKLSEEI